MDPLTLYALLSAATTTVVVATSLLVRSVRIHRRMQDSLPPPGESEDEAPASPPPVDPEEEAEPEPEPPPPEPEPEPPPPPEPEPEPEPDEEDGNGKEAGVEEPAPREKSKLEKAIDLLTAEVEFSKVMQFVGFRVVGEEAVGRYLVESTVPLAGWEIRPIRDLSEIDMLLPEELLLPDDEFFERLATGEAMVCVPIEVRNVMRPIHEEVYEELLSLGLIWVDSSGSMSGREARWRPPVWKGVIRRIIDKARQERERLIMQMFSSYLEKRMEAIEDADYAKMDHFISTHAPDGGTNLGLALRAAIDVVSQLNVDVARLTLVSDGEDKNFDPVSIRALLDEHNIQLHVIMLGVDNLALRQCAHSYQIIEPDLTVHPIVRNPRKDPEEGQPAA